MAPTFRLLPYAVADGTHNMAADEVMLETAAGGVASLRFYGWSEPTVSLGYFQQAAVRQADPQVAALAYVRRPTGGAALIHHHEVTYALALPSVRPGSSSWLARMHGVIGEALASLGVPARPFESSELESSETALCFQRPTAGDLLLGSMKVVGSAQRRQRGALLQHGAILLARSPHAPALPGIVELSGRALAVEEVSRSVLRTFVERTGWEAVAGEWSGAERQRLEELAGAKYAQETWNRKR
jgi:lipoate-protein ligase A